jgi:CDP-glucose 4,6-dehydratase
MTSPLPALVTGATGLLGQWLTRALVARGSRVVCLVYEPDRQGEWARLSPPADAIQVPGDVRDGSAISRVLGEHGIGVVYHLAAQAIVGLAADDPATTFDVNVRGTWELLEACRQSPTVRAVVVASSDKAYGDAGGRLYTEDTPLLAKNPYDASKACADLIARSYAASYGLPVAVTRCGNLYGGGDLNWSRLVPGTIRSVIAGERPVIRSDGTFVRDYLYAEDAADAYLRVADGLVNSTVPAGDAFNIATGEGVEALELARRIVTIMDADLECDVRDEAHGEIREQRLDASRVASDLGWAPNTSLDTGLTNTIAWYREFLGDPSRGAGSVQ